MTAQVGTIEMVVPDDASTLTEQCYARLHGEDCPLPAAWRVLLACPGCGLTGLRAYCDTHTAGMRRRETRGAVTKCCHVPVRVTVVEAL